MSTAVNYLGVYAGCSGTFVSYADRMLSPDEIYRLTKEAYLNNKMKALILGENPFQIPLDRYHAATHPTDWSQLLRHGIMPLLKQDYSGLIKNQIKKSLINVAKCGPVGAWSVFNLYYYYFSTSDPREKLSVFDNELRHTLRVNLLCKKHVLERNFEWSGREHKNGLWGDIMAADAILERNFKAGIFSEQERVSLQKK